MNKKKKVLVSGNFNVIHPGHIRLLRFAKERGDILIVALQSDKIAKTAAHVPEKLRLESIQNINWIDKVILIDEPVANLISKLKPDIVVKGKEYEKMYNPELKVLKKYGGNLIFSSGETIFSSLDLIHKEFKLAPSQGFAKPKEFLKRHFIKSDHLLKILKSFSELKVCVVGDLIIDEYITCEPLGMSHEDPTVVVTPIESTRFVGGSGIVAAHASGLNANVELICIVGNDKEKDFAKKTLDASGVKTNFILDNNRPTTLKQRFRSKNKTLLRVNHLHQNAISESNQKKILNKLKLIMPKCDILIFADYNYGCLPQNLVQNIIKIAKKDKVILCADSQSSSQIGDISRFKNMDLITPTEREARISIKNQNDGLVILAEKLRKQCSAKNIFLTLGQEGLFIHKFIKKNKWVTDRINPLNTFPKDEAGAGDSLLITSALALAAKANIWEAAYLGSIASAIQINKIGNIPLDLKEIKIQINK